MYKKYFTIILPILFIVFLVNIFMVGQVSAQGEESEARGSRIYEDIKKDQLDPLKKIGLPGDEADEGRVLTDLVVKVVRMILGVLALVFLVLIFYAGIKWMTSVGNTEMIDSSKKIISSALIGLLIIFLAYAITIFVFNVLLKQ